MAKQKIPLTQPPKDINYGRAKNIFWGSIFLPLLQQNQSNIFERTGDKRFKLEGLSLALDPRFFNIYKNGKLLVKLMYKNITHFSTDVIGGTLFLNINDSLYIKAQ